MGKGKRQGCEDGRWWEEGIGGVSSVEAGRVKKEKERKRKEAKRERQER
jgi:hypothetical protein